VEDGVPFCKHCGAPQIRVVGVEAQPPAAPDVPDTTEGLPVLPPLASPAVPSGGVQWSQALPGAALAGAFSLLAAIIPFAVFGPAFMAGGALSVILYRRHVKDRLPSPGDGAQIGAASGGFGFLFFAIFVVATLVYRPDELRQPMLDRIAQAVARGYDPQKIEQMQQTLKTPEGLTFAVGFGLFMLFLIFVAGSSIGGALYAAWLRKRLQL
jgi:hypothetical protein